MIQAPLGRATAPKPPPLPDSFSPLWPVPPPPPPRTDAAGITVTPPVSYGSPYTRLTLATSRTPSTSSSNTEVSIAPPFGCHESWLRCEPTLRDRGGGLARRSVEARAELLRELDERLGGGGAVAVAVPGEADDPRRHPRAELERDDAVVARVRGELRRDRDAGAGGDQTVDGRVLVRVEDVVRLEPAAAEVGVELLAAPAQAGADERQLGRLAQRDRLVPGREGRVGGDEQDPGVAHQLDRLERALGKRRHHEAQVELSALDVLEQLGIGGRLDQVHLDARPLLAEAAHQLGQDPRAGALERADAERAAVARDHRGHVRARRVQPGHDRLGVPKPHLAGGREGHRPRPSGPLDELCAADLLHRRDLLADRRLRVPETGRRAANRALLGDRLEGGEMPYFDPEP